MKLLYQVLAVSCGLGPLSLVHAQCSSSNMFIGYSTWDIQNKLGLQYQDAEDLFYKAFYNSGGSGSFQDSNGGNLNFRTGQNGFTVTSSCGSNYGGSNMQGASSNMQGNNGYGSNAGYSSNSGYFSTGGNNQNSNMGHQNFGGRRENNMGRQNFKGHNLRNGQNAGASRSSSSWSWSSSSSSSSSSNGGRSRHGSNQGYNMGNNQQQNGNMNHQQNGSSNNNLKSASNMAQNNCQSSQGGFCDYSTYCIEDVFGVSNAAAHSLFNAAFYAGVGSQGTWRNQETGQAFQFQCYQDGFQAAPIGGGC